MRTTRVTVMVFFRILHPESYLISAIFEVSFQQLWGALTAAFQKTPYKTWKDIMKRKSKKLPWKLQVAEKPEPALQTTLHENGSHFVISIFKFS